MKFPCVLLAVLLLSTSTLGEPECVKTRTITKKKGSIFCPIIKMFLRKTSCTRTITLREPCDDGSNIDCTTSDKKFHKHLYDNSKYWECTPGVIKPVGRSCSTNGAKIWDATKQTCIRTGHEICLNTDKVYENRADCRSYYECKDRVRTVWLCPQGYKFQKDAAVNSAAPHCAPGTCVNSS